MKKIFIISLLTVTLCLCACTGTEKNISDYQVYPMTVTGTLSQGDFSCALTLALTDKNKAEIRIDSPKTLSGYRFTVDNDGIWVYYDDMPIDICAARSDIPLLWVVDMLCLADTDFKYSRKEEDTVTLFCDSGSAETVIYIRKNEDFPYRIEHKRDQRYVCFDIDTFIIQ